MVTVRADTNLRWKHGPVVEAAGNWVGERRGVVPELGDGSAGLGSGRRELAPVRCLMIGWAAAESWVAWR
jgi:hypothetical protein